MLDMKNQRIHQKGIGKNFRLPKAQQWESGIFSSEPTIMTNDEAMSVVMGFPDNYNYN